jgi:hypothetical protein
MKFLKSLIFQNFNQFLMIWQEGRVTSDLSKQVIPPHAKHSYKSKGAKTQSTLKP